MTMQYFLALVYSYLDFFVNVAYISLFMIPALHLLKVSIFFVSKLIVFVVCFPKYLKNFFMQCIQHAYFLYHHIVHIAEVQYLQGICSPSFGVDDFSELFLHLSILLI